MHSQAAFAAAFPAATEADWLQRAVKALKDASSDTLFHATEDGISVQPLYPLDAGGRLVAGRAGPWRTVQRIDHPDPATALRDAGEAAAGGAGGIALVFAGSPAAWGAGIAPGAGLPMPLAGLSAIQVDAGEDSFDLAARIAPASEAAALEILFDPLATLAANGRLVRPFAAHVAEAVVLANSARRPAIVLAADGRRWHAAGATAVMELGAVMASLAAILREAAGQGTDPATLLPAIGVALAVDGDLIEGIAKLRALRVLHARLTEALGAPPAPVRLHAETAWRMATRCDPDGNILRNGLAAFAAAIGGADSIAVLPHTAALGPADHGALRIARNLLLVLAEEAHLGRVADPAGGSGAVETLTEVFAAEAWQRMQAIEAAGGLLAALKAGTIQAEIAAAATARAARVAAGEVVLVGSTRFAAPEPAPAVDPLPPPARRDAAAAAETAAPLVPAPLEPR